MSFSASSASSSSSYASSSYASSSFTTTSQEATNKQAAGQQKNDIESEMLTQGLEAMYEALPYGLSKHSQEIPSLATFDQNHPFYQMIKTAPLFIRTKDASGRYDKFVDLIKQLINPSQRAQSGIQVRCYQPNAPARDDGFIFVSGLNKQFPGNMLVKDLRQYLPGNDPVKKHSQYQLWIFSYIWASSYIIEDYTQLSWHALESRGLSIAVKKAVTTPTEFTIACETFVKVASIYTRAISLFNDSVSSQRQKLIDENRKYLLDQNPNESRMWDSKDLSVVVKCGKVAVENATKEGDFKKALANATVEIAVTSCKNSNAAAKKIAEERASAEAKFKAFTAIKTAAEAALEKANLAAEEAAMIAKQTAEAAVRAKEDAEAKAAGAAQAEDELKCLHHTHNVVKAKADADAEFHAEVTNAEIRVKREAEARIAAEKAAKEAEVEKARQAAIAAAEKIKQEAIAAAEKTRQAAIAAAEKAAKEAIAAAERAATTTQQAVSKKNK